MRLTGILVALLFMLGILMFLSVNLGQQVDIRFPFINVSFLDLELHIVMIYTFSIGILIGFLLPIFLVLEFKMENYRLSRNLKKIQDELNNLRNVAIQEELESEIITEVSIETEEIRKQSEIKKIPRI